MKKLDFPSKKTNEEFLIIFSKLIKKRSKIFRISFYSFIIGIIFSLCLKNQYKTSTTFIPQISNEIKPSSSLSGLASLAGIDLNNVSNDSKSIPPSLYPQIVSSTEFKIELLNSEINIDEEKIKVRDYLLGKKKSIFNTIKEFPYMITDFFRKNESIENSEESDLYSITKIDYDLFKKISEKLTLTINENEGFINLSFTDEKKEIAATITKIAQEILQKRVINFKIKSSKELLDFSVDQYIIKKKAFESLQDEIANFRDKNLNISSSLFKNKLDRLNSELSISQSVVQQLASQVEQAKLQVSKDTPVFTIINEVSIPYKKSYPKRSLIVILFTILGFTISITFYTVSPTLKNFREKIIDSESYSE